LKIYKQAKLPATER